MLSVCKGRLHCATAMCGTRTVLGPKRMSNIQQKPLFPGIRKDVTKFEGQYTFSYGTHSMMLLRESGVAAVIPAGIALPFLLSYYATFPVVPLEWKAVYFAGVLLLTRLLAKGPRNTVVKDLTGRHIVVTGGTSGVGREAAAQFAAMGADVTVIARDSDHVESAMQYIRSAFRGPPESAPTIRFQALNLSDFIAVRDYCKRARQSRQGIDVLVNGAGVLQQFQVTTRFGDDMQLAVNFLGPYLLTEGLLPLVEATQGRVVYVSCSAHVGVKGNIVSTYLTGRGVWSPRVANKFDGLEQYGFTKLGNIYHAQDLAIRSYPDPARHSTLRLAARAATGAKAAAAPSRADEEEPAFTTCACNPGGVITNIYRDVAMSRVFHYFYYLFYLFMRSPREGSQTIVNCAIRDEIKTGGYYMNTRYRPEGLSAAACNAKEREQVMAWTRRKMLPYMKWD